MVQLLFNIAMLGMIGSSIIWRALFISLTFLSAVRPLSVMGVNSSFFGQCVFLNEVMLD